MNKEEYINLENRMKKYEFESRGYLKTRTPVIIRIDGKAFHTFTKNFNKPFEEPFAIAMQKTMKYLCENIQGCVLGYTQSDEISLILVDYKNINTSAWFDYNIQKCASVAASMATMAFNNAFKEALAEYSEFVYSEFATGEDERHYRFLCNVAEDCKAMFDARVYNVPKEEVCNNLYWRQHDAIRNSIQMVGNAHFTHSELQHKATSQIQEMLLKDYDVDWNNLPTMYKWGSCCVRRLDKTTGRNKWVIDNEIPIFKNEGCQYINELIFINEA